MNGRGFLAVVAVIILVGMVGVGSVLGFVGGGSGGVGSSLLGDTDEPSAFLHFESAGAHCTDEFRANSSTEVVADTNTRVTHSRNISLPGASYAIGGPTFERVNESTYVLNVPIEETKKAPRPCSGVARYTGTMRIPTGEDPWQIHIKHDGETVTTLYGDSQRSALGGAVSAGQNVSEPDPRANSRTPSA